HNAAAPPHLGDVGQVEVVALVSRQLRRGTAPHDVKALGEGLHHAVLDPVMDHLDEMPGADGPGMDVAALGARVELLASFGALGGPAPGPRGGEHRHKPLPAPGTAADHQAVAALRPPPPPRRPDIEMVVALGLELARAAYVVFEVGVAPVDNGVPRTHQPAE